MSLDIIIPAFSSEVFKFPAAVAVSFTKVVNVESAPATLSAFIASSAI